MLLAIETSCDETAVTLFRLETSKAPASNLKEKIVYEKISSQFSCIAEYGGVVPELAAREHINNLPLMVRNALKETNTNLSDIECVAVTVGPGLKGCLLVGLSFAKSFALALGIPLIPVNHLEAHLFSATLSNELKENTLVLLVSGGHTQLLIFNRFRDYRLIADTRDDAAGEAFDKGAVLLGLGYPGGPALSKKAEHGDEKRFKFPIAVPKIEDAFSFSGLKTALARQVKEVGELSDQDISDLAASYQLAIVESLMIKVDFALKKYGCSSLLVTGGVAANLELRKRAEEHCDIYDIPFLKVPTSWCTDNASMVAAVAQAAISARSDEYLNWKSNFNEPGKSLRLGPDADMSLGVKSRWPLAEL